MVALRPFTKYTTNAAAVFLPSFKHDSLFMVKIIILYINQKMHTNLAGASQAAENSAAEYELATPDTGTEQFGSS